MVRQPALVGTLAVSGRSTRAADEPPGGRRGRRESEEIGSPTRQHIHRLHALNSHGNRRSTLSDDGPHADEED